MQSLFIFLPREGMHTYIINKRHCIRKKKQDTQLQYFQASPYVLSTPASTSSTSTSSHPLCCHIILRGLNCVFYYLNRATGCASTRRWCLGVSVRVDRERERERLWKQWTDEINRAREIDRFLLCPQSPPLSSFPSTCMSLTKSLLTIYSWSTFSD